MRNEYEVLGDVTYIYYHKLRKNRTYVIKVDTEDLDLILEHASSIYVHDVDTHYALYYCKKAKRHKYLHRLIANTPEHLVGDHINLNSLDNRKQNLRNCTNAENQQNRPLHKNNKTGVRGVNYFEFNQKYKGTVTLNKVTHDFGYFDTLEEAASVVREFRKKHMPYATN